MRPQREAPRATLLYILAREASTVPVLAQQAAELTGIDPDGLSIRTSEQLLSVNSVITGQLGSLSRQIAVGVLGLGLILVLLTVSLALASRRSDMGRRRALGSSRSALVALLILTVGIPSILGTALGSLAGTSILLLTGSHMPTVPFVLAVGALVVVAAALATLPPAVSAALRDPVRILRVP